MRIKEQIKKSGFFWLPSMDSNSSDAPPHNAVSGTLSISDGGDIELELTQPLVTSIRDFKLDDLNQILGHVETYGRVTVDRCQSITPKHSIVHGVWMESELIKANRVFTGIRYKEDVPPRFNTVTFSVEGIDEWVGISGIKVDRQYEKRALTISYNFPEDILFNLENGMQLQVTFFATFPGIPTTKRAEISQKIYFELISQEARELDEFISVASKITTFLCFVMNKIVCLDSISATSNDLRQDGGNGRTVPIIVGIYCPSWPYTKDEPEINKMDMLFGFEEKQNRAESLINKWLQNYERTAPAFDLYFLAKAGTLPTLNLQFLTLAQALEAFHRKTSREIHMNEDEFEEIRRALVKKCPKRERDWFAQKLNYANELTLRNRFEKMTEPFSNFMCGESRPRLIDKIVKTRHYLTHYDSDLESEIAKGEVMQFLCYKMNALFRLHFLKLIGFNEPEIDAIVDECPYFKGACNS